MVRFVQREVESIQYLLLPPYRAKLIGHPILMSLTQPSITPSQLYEAVLAKTLQFVHESERERALERAHEGKYPFELKTVAGTGAVCSQCRWTDKHCLGCLIDPSSRDTVELGNLCTLAIDWEMDFFSAHEEQAVRRHESVDQQEQTLHASYSLLSCMEADARPEKLEYKCSACESSWHTSQTLVDHAPDILAVHLKRFTAEYVDGKFRSSKNHTMVEIPLDQGLDLSSCLLYTSDAADEEDSVDLGGRRIIKKKKRTR
eukprot:TRINITY_DN31690_c0_g1_i1.p1 TRINITY_DN31690_c0_g1~~TRINITY_DN31690_c0_g1_i1.p1  ORF type:complete len:259 (-),score=61.48 TRINITY_DN31690_c0_g1_i1:5-781(-)